MEGSVSVQAGGKRLEVAAGATALQALAQAGAETRRFDSCRNGSCGACLVVCSTPGTEGPRLRLACQTSVTEGMWIGAVPADRKPSAAYDLSELAPTGAALKNVYPAIDSCEPCGACSSSCPQRLDVSGYMAAMRSGDLGRASALSMECTACTACSIACPEHLDPYRYAVLARRLHARSLAAPADLASRVAEVRDGAFAEELARLAATPEDALAARFVSVRTERAGRNP